MYRILYCVFLLLLFPVSAYGESKKIEVVVSEFEPTVIKKADGTFTGFEIEIWERIAFNLNLDFQYREVAEFRDLLGELSADRADVAIAGITITKDREIRNIDFSHRNLDSGLQILVLQSKQGAFSSFLKVFLNADVLTVLMALMLFSGLMALLFVVIHRNDSTMVSCSFLDGLYWAIVTMSTVGYGDYTPKNKAGKILAMVTILFGLIILGNYIATISSIKVSERIDTAIQGPADLRGKRVATLEGATSVDILKSLGADQIQASKMSEAYRMLLSHEVDAVVYDSPALPYYSHNEGRDKVVVVGPIFDRQDYGFALREGSSLREQVNRELLEMQRSGTYNQLYQKYFGQR